MFSCAQCGHEFQLHDDPTEECFGLEISEDGTEVVKCKCSYFFTTSEYIEHFRKKQEPC